MTLRINKYKYFYLGCLLMIVFASLKTFNTNLYLALPFAIIGVLSFYYGIFDYFKQKRK